MRKNRIAVTCQYCKKIKYVIQSRVNITKYCSPECFYKTRKGSKHKQETIEKIRKAALEQFKDGMPEETKDKIKQSNLEKHSGKNNGMWQGEKIKRRGRWYIWINRKRQLQSRVITEQRIGRKLNKSEIVHHINENKSDDRLENLYLFSTNGQHTRQHRLKKTPNIISNLV